jgi:hypothetical protein
VICGNKGQARVVKITLLLFATYHVGRKVFSAPVRSKDFEMQMTSNFKCLKNLMDAAASRQ